MTDVNFTVSAGGDDGWCRTDEASFDNSSNSVYIGSYFGGNPARSFFRFDNVSIPAGATIDNAYVRFTAQINGSTTTVNLNCFFEDADDPTAPTTAADLMGRSLTTGIAWDGLSAWTDGNTYDTPDISTSLQDVIDRGGWSSGQAVIALIQDDGSSAGAQRQASSYDYVLGAEAAILYVTYSVPFNIDVSDSVEISESVSMLKDLAVSASDNINATESLTVAPDRHIDVFDSIETSELVEVIPTFGGALPLKSENINISEFVSLERGFSGQLTNFENINISEFRSIELEALPISVAENLTITEFVRTTNLIDDAFDNISISESVTAKRGYEAGVSVTSTITSTFSLFHYTNWINQNAARANQRFFFTLTGATDLTTDVEIPISSIFARKRSGDPTYLQVVIPSFNYSQQVSDRPSGAMVVEMGYELDGEIDLREQILVADLEDIRLDEGAVNRSITLSGHRTTNYGGNLVTFQRKQVTYRAVQTRARVFRFAFIDPFLNPGDTVVVGDESFTCNNIVYIINPLRSMMEVREAL